MSIRKLMTKVNLESEAEETVGATEEDILDVIESDEITAELVEASKEANEAAEADQELTDLAEEVTETIGDIEEKLEDTADVEPEDVAVAQESLRHYKKMLGIKDEGTKISLESMRVDTKANLEGIKVELEGILDTIKDSAKKIWKWILSILAKLGELIRSGFKHIQGFYRSIVWSDKTKQAKFYEEVMKEVSRKTKYVSPAVFYNTSFEDTKADRDPKYGNAVSYNTYVKFAADAILDNINKENAFSDTIYSFYKPEELAEFYPKAIKLVCDTTTKLMDNIQILLAKIEKARQAEKLALDAFADKDEVAKTVITLFEDAIEGLKALNKRKVTFYGRNEWAMTSNISDGSKALIVPKSDNSFITIKLDETFKDSDSENARFAYEKFYMVTEGSLQEMLKKNDTFVHDLGSLERAFTSCEKQYSDLSNDIASIERLAKSLDNKEQSLTSLLDKYSKELYLFKNAKIAVRSFVMLFNNLLVAYENYNSYLVKSIGKINKAADIPYTLK